MLKLIYTENDLQLELLEQPLEEWVKTRVTLYLCSGISLWIDPSTASFLLPTDLSHLVELKTELEEICAVSLVDADYLEISIEGTWVASEPDSEEGIFVTQWSDRTELSLYTLWLEAQDLAAVTEKRG